MKCLPQNKLALAKGNVLHDSHAEVLAIRAFNRWLVDECADLAAQGAGSIGNWVKWRSLSASTEQNDTNKPAVSAEDGHALPNDTHWQEQAFALHDDVDIHMYCSEAPCGDASMELTMAAQDDDSPWTRDIPDPDGLLGRGYFDQLGIVRRKPARSDAPASFSKSCSDKLALKQCTSLLNGVTSLLVHPAGAYLKTIVLPSSQCVPSAVQRAFGREGRLHPVADEDIQQRWRKSGHAFRPFEVSTTDLEFDFSRRQTVLEEETLLPSNLSAIYTTRRLEAHINGTLQGRKQFDPRGASCVSRRLMWESVKNILPEGQRKRYITKSSYAELKTEKDLTARENVKSDVRGLALKGWKRNFGDEDWYLEGWLSDNKTTQQRRQQ